MKQNTTKMPAPLTTRLSRTEGQATVEDVLSRFWLYMIAQMGERLDSALWTHGQFHEAAKALSLSAEIAPLGSGLARPEKVQAFQESALDLEEMLAAIEAMAGQLKRAVRGCQDGRGDFKLDDPATRATLFAFLREDPDGWSLFGQSGYDWGLLTRQARVKHRTR